MALQPARTLLSPTLMGRPLRRQVPGQYYQFTTRCHQARCFLRPDDETNQAVLEWLTRAQLLYPELRILSVCVMSNHLHMVVHDQVGLLSNWASYFLGNLSRAINRIRGRSGTFYQRRYSAEPILDDEALIDRLVYTVANPVKAGLCSRVDQWPGIVLFARGSRREEIPVSWIDRNQQRRARKRAQRRGDAKPESEEYRVQQILVIHPLLDATTDAGESRAAAAIEARETELGLERRNAGLRPLGRAKILAQSWHAAPKAPKHEPRPLCHSASLALREAFREGYRTFVELFREASERLRDGDLQVSFPDWSFPPGRPLVRPMLAGSG